MEATLDYFILLPQDFSSHEASSLVVWGGRVAVCEGRVVSVLGIWLHLQPARTTWRQLDFWCHRVLSVRVTARLLPMLTFALTCGERLCVTLHTIKYLTNNKSYTYAQKEYMWLTRTSLSLSALAACKKNPSPESLTWKWLTVKKNVQNTISAQKIFHFLCDVLFLKPFYKYRTSSGALTLLLGVGRRTVLRYVC